MRGMDHQRELTNHKAINTWSQVVKRSSLIVTILPSKNCWCVFINRIAMRKLIGVQTKIGHKVKIY